MLAIPDLEITDFGGSTGDHGTALLETFPHARYTVVETKSMATAAKTISPKIIFTSELPKSCDLFFTSGTLQYLPDPYAVASAAFKSARRVCIFIRNSFSASEMFHVQESEMFSNGGGAVPPGYKNEVIRYPHRTIEEPTLVALGKREGFVLAARIPDPDRVWPSKAGAYGAQLLFVRHPAP